ncbi:MAG TPA: ATP-binding cassette domain-containing protein [Candidatus Polarisedimenticolaceae bacterium]|nr:ATP-binding cassette domain-containing protein [Candidatus Polarisedimenticolaceae bacterium]
MADAIVLRGLTKTFGETVAVRNLDLTVPEGGLYGVIGPNGAGKTTTIRMILSIQFPDRGELQVLGRASALEAKDRIGYLPEERGLYKKMRVGAFLTYMARLKGADGPDLKQRVRSWLERVALAEVENKRCEELSKGMQQKVQFVAAVIHRPDLLILDEPFSGLDPVNQRLLRDLVLEEHRRGATVLFSTHVMIHAELLCDHIVMIHRGDKVLDDSIAQIRAKFDPRSVLYEPMDGSPDVRALAALPGVESVHREGAAWELALVEGTDPAAVITALATSARPARIEVRRPTLEDAFMNIVSPAAAEDRARLRAALREPGATGEVVKR